MNKSFYTRLSATDAAKTRLVSNTSMQTSMAITNLQNLKDEAEQQGLQLRPSAKFSSWKGRAQSVLTRALGADHHLTKTFIDVRYRRY